MLLFALSQSLKSFADVLRWQHRDVITLIISALLLVAAVALHLAIVLLDVLAGVRSVSKSEAVGFGARRRAVDLHQVTHRPFFGAPTSPWVLAELIRLKALAPQAGVRMIAEMFNRKFEITRRMTVSKSYVATALKKHRLSILHMRRELKNRIPREMPKNRVWGMDLTTITDDAGVQHLAFGVIDHGSRLGIALELIANKHSSTLLWILLRYFAKFGKPRIIRADNESCFKSRLMRTTLAALGVKLQHSTPLSPWENGRIERFFGTLKQALATALVPTMSVHAQLAWFRNYYNHFRPHQHLGYRTPMEAWTGNERQCGDALADFWEAQFFRPA